MVNNNGKVPGGKVPGNVFDPLKSPDMKCYCGNDIFIEAMRLKYIPVFMRRDPRINTIASRFFVCANPACGQQYPSAMSAEDINKIGDARKKIEAEAAAARRGAANEG